MDEKNKERAVILLVEDEESLLKLATHILEMRGYRVLAAAESETALHQAQEFPQRIDLLLTDVRMDPHISGCVLAQHLRPARPDMHVIYMTSFPVSEIVRRDVNHGHAVLLKKPFTPTALLEKVQETLSSHPHAAH
jgi:two-component system cell cycle sensor histidine kinase/response regulator CckA